MSIEKENLLSQIKELKSEYDEACRNFNYCQEHDRLDEMCEFDEYIDMLCITIIELQVQYNNL